jgi:hypothetical protein
MKSFALKEALNRYFEDGFTNFRKVDIESYGEGDWPRIKECLRNWESRGLVKTLVSIDEANEEDVVVKVLGFIDIDTNKKLP